MNTVISWFQFNWNSNKIFKKWKWILIFALMCIAPYNSPSISPFSFLFLSFRCCICTISMLFTLFPKSFISSSITPLKCSIILELTTNIHFHFLNILLLFQLYWNQLIKINFTREFVYKNLDWELCIKKISIHWISISIHVTKYIMIVNFSIQCNSFKI